MFKNKRFSLLLSGTVLCALSVALASVASAAPEPATFMRDVQPAFRTDEIPVIRKDSPLFNYSTEGALEQIKMTGIYKERADFQGFGRAPLHAVSGPDSSAEPAQCLLKRPAAEESSDYQRSARQSGFRHSRSQCEAV